MHKLTVNVPDDLVKSVKRLAIDHDTDLGKIITSCFLEIDRTGKVPPRPEVAPAARPGTDEG